MDPKQTRVFIHHCTAGLIYFSFCSLLYVVYRIIFPHQHITPQTLFICTPTLWQVARSRLQLLRFSESVRAVAFCSYISVFLEICHAFPLTTVALSFY